MSRSAARAFSWSATARAGTAGQVAVGRIGLPPGNGAGTTALMCLEGVDGRGHSLGVNLRDLFEPRPVPAGWFDGKRIAVDGHNVAFRYLTSFRGRDGDVLRAPDGRAIG